MAVSRSGNVGVAGGIYGNAISIGAIAAVNIGAAQKGGVDQTAAVGIELGDKGFSAVEAASGVGLRDPRCCGKIADVIDGGKTGDIGKAGGIHGDGAAAVIFCCSQKGGIKSESLQALNLATTASIPPAKSGW